MNYKLACFKYAPRNWSVLAHGTGGILAAIQSSPCLTLLLIPAFLFTMFANVIRFSKHHHLIHANWAVCGFASGLAARITRKKLITTFRGTDVSNLDSFLPKFIVACCLKLSHKVVTVSKEMQDQLVKRWPQHQHKIVHIPNGIDDEFFKIPTIPDITNKFDIITIDNLVPNKSVKTIINAVSKLTFDYNLTIVGDGHEHDFLSKLATKYRQTESIHFLGQQPPTKISHYLSHHQIRDFTGA